MSDRADQLAATLIRNFNDAPLKRLLREPHYDAQGSRLARGTAAQKLGASFDILAPGKRGCPYHLHHAQEEMFVILEGNGTLRVAGEMLPDGSPQAGRGSARMARSHRRDQRGRIVPRSPPRGTGRAGPGRAGAP